MASGIIYSIRQMVDLIIEEGRGTLDLDPIYAATGVVSLDTGEPGISLAVVDGIGCLLPKSKVRI